MKVAKRHLAIIGGSEPEWKDHLSTDFRISEIPTVQGGLHKLHSNPLPDVILLNAKVLHHFNQLFYSGVIRDTTINSIPVILIDQGRKSGNEQTNALQSFAIDCLCGTINEKDLKAKIEAILRYRDNLIKYFSHRVSAALNDPRHDIYHSARSNSGHTGEGFYNRCIALSISPREMQVLKILSRGMTYREIGQELHISEKR